MKDDVRHALMADRWPIPLDEGDYVDVHSKVAAALRQIGLDGHALDEAANSCARITATIVARERDTEAKRRASIRLVE